MEKCPGNNNNCPINKTDDPPKNHHWLSVLQSKIGTQIRATRKTLREQRGFDSLLVNGGLILAAGALAGMLLRGGTLFMVAFGASMLLSLIGYIGGKAWPDPPPPRKRRRNTKRRTEHEQEEEDSNDIDNKEKENGMNTAKKFSSRLFSTIPSPEELREQEIIRALILKEMERLIDSYHTACHDTDIDRLLHALSCKTIREKDNHHLPHHLNADQNSIWKRRQRHLPAEPANNLVVAKGEKLLKLVKARAAAQNFFDPLPIMDINGEKNSCFLN